jgi:ABC-type transport system involved in cytochrome c biogenesis permease subunit
MTPTDPTAAPARPPRDWGRVVPWVVLGIAALYLLSAAGRMSPPAKPYDLNALATLPVVDGGRVKPLDTVARVYLRQISHREEFVDENGDKQPAIRWYLDVVAGGPEGRGRVGKYRVFRIENDQLLAELGLKAREGLRYSLEELSGIGKLRRTAQAAADRREAKQPIDKFEEKLLDLYKKINLYETLAQGAEPLLLPPTDGGKPKAFGAFQAECRRAALAEALGPTQAKLREDGRFAALTPDQRKQLLTALGGFGDAGPDPAGRLLSLLRDDPTRLSAEDLRARLQGFEKVMTEAEGAELFARAEAGEARRLAANPGAVLWTKLVDAYREGVAARDPGEAAKKAEEFNATLADFRAAVGGYVAPADAAKAKAEAYYNRFAPFYHCTALYVLVVFLCCLSWLGWTEPLRRSAFLVLYLTLILHTAALIGRMYFQDRWGVFVTNLYSSAVFIGWGCVVLGLVLEKLYPIGIGAAVGAVLGVGATIISHNLGAASDTLEMMQAVLDTNFWLATHVTTVTFGYTATFVAGFIGVAYVARMLATVVRDSFRRGGRAPAGELFVFAVAALGLVAVPTMLLAVGLKAAADFEVFPGWASELLTFLAVAGGVVYALVLTITRASLEGVPGDPLSPAAAPPPALARPVANLALDPDATKKLTQMIYGVVCFATLLSFVGTVLGGIWADQSWGRFWGWDPKENGAVLIVLWNALILHARWCGLVRDRGLAVLAVAGNMVTAWSWFGTNQLGIGLHAYGFDKRLAVGCRYFWLSQLVIIGLGLIPRSYWPGATRKLAGGLGTTAAAATAPVSAAPVQTAAARPAVNGTNGAPRQAKGKPGRRR